MNIIPLALHMEQVDQGGHTNHNELRCEVCESITNNIELKPVECNSTSTVNDHESVTGESGSSLHKSCDTSLSVDDEDLVLSEDEEDIVCNECGGQLRNGDRRFFKCSVCKHFNLCFSCNNSNKHSHHANDIQLFRDPLYPKAGYCKSCGYQFYPERGDTFHVYHCTKCVHYALCFNCKKTQRHHHHDEHLQKILLREYKGYIT